MEIRRSFYIYRIIETYICRLLDKEIIQGLFYICIIVDL